MRKIRKIRLGFTVIFFGAVFTLRASTLTVPTDYSTIQDAVNAAQSGDKILVLPGTYEPVEIGQGKNNVTLISDGHSSVIRHTDESVAYAGITVKANNVLIKGFTVSGFFAGIFIQDCSGVQIEDNTTVNATHGIQFVNATSCRATQNASTLNFNGAEVSQSTDITLAHNEFSNNQNNGISVVLSEACSLIHNQANENYNGIYILYFSGTPGETGDQQMTVAHNRTFHNTASGITVDHSCGGSFTLNVAKDNGIDLVTTEDPDAPCNGFRHNVGQTAIPSPEFWK